MGRPFGAGGDFGRADNLGPGIPFDMRDTRFVSDVAPNLCFSLLQMQDLYNKETVQDTLPVKRPRVGGIAVAAFTFRACVLGSIPCSSSCDPSVINTRKPFHFSEKTPKIPLSM